MQSQFKVMKMYKLHLIQKCTPFILACKSPVMLFYKPFLGRVNISTLLNGLKLHKAKDPEIAYLSISGSYC